MKYTIWRMSSDGTSIQIQTAGETSVIERAFEKVRVYNERLKSGEPDSEDRFLVLDSNGNEVTEDSEIKVAVHSRKKTKTANPAPESETVE
jgi:hypothetical protein